MPTCIAAAAPRGIIVARYVQEAKRETIAHQWQIPRHSKTKMHIGLETVHANTLTVETEVPTGPGLLGAVADEDDCNNFLDDGVESASEEIVESVETENFSTDSTLAGNVLGKMAVIFPRCHDFHTPKHAVQSHLCLRVQYL